ncbi:hypothetical protein Gohar_018646 [Gossypium harknessii]|uniref:RNase H type-1 domain-containing protein n=1 Tax=Gossypium harknessii TaxID=34285 RepID=A0A7J9G9M0_9ROSI|nr:hypothetical protein [Gossypium harknessii]
MESCIYLWDKLSDPTTTEAKACLQALIFAEDLRFREVSVESDALTVNSKRSGVQTGGLGTTVQLAEILGGRDPFRSGSPFKQGFWESEESQQLVRLGNTAKYRKIWVKVTTISP